MRLTPDNKIGSPASASHIGLNAHTKRGRRITWTHVFSALVTMLLVAAAWLIFQALAIKDDFEMAAESVVNLQDEIATKEFVAAEDTLAILQIHTSNARSATSSPIWKAAQYLPGVGSNFRALTEVAISSDEVVSHAAVPLLGLLLETDISKFAPADGRVDLDLLKSVTPVITESANTVQLSYERLDSIQTAGLFDDVARPLALVVENLGSVRETLNSAASAVELLPSMLGSNEERNYLLLIQNNAEVRATGGIAGALAIVSIDDGVISLGQQSSATALGSFNPQIEVPADQEALYTGRLGTQMQNVNMTPDFPTAALTAKRMWEARMHSEIDGVVALDPVVLSKILQAIGPVQLTDPGVQSLIEGTNLPLSLTSDNVVSTLLSSVYSEISDPTEQDVYFASVASVIFAEFTKGKGDLNRLYLAFTQSSQEDRIYIWSALDREQEILSSTPLAGAIGRQGVPGSNFGLYLNDGTGAKMDFYAERTVRLIQSCRTDGYRDYALQVTISNTAPVDAATSLPPYVTGDGAFGVRPGSIRTNYVAYGPVQSFVESAMLNSVSVPVATGNHGPRPVGSVAVEVAPGESAVLEIAFSHVVQGSMPEIQMTPVFQSKGDVILPTMEDASCR